MKTWKDWSDAEISKEVAALNGLTVGNKLTSMRNNSSATVNNGGGFWYEVDYCNNWLDMGPIIVEHGIELSPLFSGGWCASSIKYYTYEEDPVYGIQHVHKNPLRAAAIVFLEMNGFKP